MIFPSFSAWQFPIHPKISSAQENNRAPSRQRDFPPCFIITIEPDVGQRAQSALRQLAPLGIASHIVEGVRPDDIAIESLYSRSLNFRYMKRPLGRGEVAVYSSHRRALEMFLKTDSEFAIVLEDDFEILRPDHFVDEVLRILDAPLEWDLIKLFDYLGSKKPKKPIARLDLGPIAIVEYKTPRAGMVGYIVRRSGAEKLISRPHLFRPIDEDLKYYWELDLWSFSVVPCLLAEISDRLGGSYIELERRRLRDDRSIRRSIRGNKIKVARMLHHFMNHHRYCLTEAMRAHQLKQDSAHSFE
jgi:GR25 family glycosyltransferase involved in LPS biosynthesis